MSQHDLDVANQGFSAFRTDMNAALVALGTLQSGATAPATTFAHMLWADTTANLLKRRNAANSGWLVVRSLDESFVLSRSSNTILAGSDIGKTISATSTFTQTLTAAATLGDGWSVQYRNNGTGIITIDANSTETIDGAQALVLQPGESCILNCNGTGFVTTGRQRTAALGKAIFGLTYANNGTDSIDIAAGGAMDATGAYWMSGAALTKNITTAWAVGTAAGMLDTGSVGNSDYYLWMIARSDTGVVDYLGSLSSTAPTMPSGYDFKRLIGWFKRVGGTNVAFTTYETEGGGIEFAWNAPSLDINLNNTLSSARRTDAIKVPLNFSVLAHIVVSVYDASSNFTGYVCCPDLTDTAPANQGVQLSIFNTQSTTLSTNFKMDVRTSATGTIAARTNLATVDNYIVSTYGFRLARRN